MICSHWNSINTLTLLPTFQNEREKNLLSKCKEVCRRKVGIMSLETLMKVYVRISQPKNTLSQSLSFSALSLQQPNAISLHVFFICPFSPSLAVSGHVCCNFGACENQRENTFFFLHTIVIVLNSVCRCQINWTERHTTHIPVQYIERHIKTQPRKKKYYHFLLVHQVASPNEILKRNNSRRRTFWFRVFVQSSEWVHLCGLFCDRITQNALRIAKKEQ